jgi:hypothetical protein
MNLLAQVSSPMFLLPAYGRSYKTKQEALSAWNSGKDFQIYRGPYCSKRDIDQLHDLADRVYIQYDNGIVEV